MPTGIVLVCAALGLVPVLWQMRRLSGWSVRVFVLFLWARFVTGALHETTSNPLFGGISISALVTMSFAVLLVLFVDHDELQRPRHALFLPLFAVFLLSSVLNGETSGLVIEAIAWTLFVGALFATQTGIARNGVTRIMIAILATGATPVLLQFASIATRTTIGSELDGSLGYIGGYIHESVFSRILFILFVASCLAGWRYRSVGVALSVYFLLSIFLSNYRTTILAALPGVMVVSAVTFLLVFRSRFQVPVAFLLLFTGTVIGVAAIPLLPERYLEIFDVIGRYDELIQRPVEFTFQERRLFSYRLYLWSQYIYAYIQGNPLELVFGNGSFAYEKRFNLSAHSSYVSYLYEYGIIGVVVLITVLLANLGRAFLITDGERRAVVVSMHVGFMILNLTTVALKSVEGVVIYAIILAVTNASIDDSVPAPHTARSRPPTDGIRPGAAPALVHHNSPT